MVKSFVLLAGIIGIFVILTTVAATMREYSPVLMMDQWDNFDPTRLWHGLFNQHNEHRILIPRLMFLVDAYFFDQDNSFLLTAVLITQFVHVFLFWWILGFSNNTSADTRAGLTFLSSAFLFALIQNENFFTGFQTQFVGVFAAATASFAALAKSREFGPPGSVLSMPKPLFWLVVSLTCFIISLLMMSNGVLAGMLLIPLGLWLRVPFRHLAAVAVVFIAGLAAYLYGYQSPNGHSRPLESLVHLDGILLYLITYLGAPFGGFAKPLLAGLDGPAGTLHILAARIAGGFGLVSFLGLGALMAVNARRDDSRAEAALYAVLTMIVVTGAVTGLGRLTFSADQALASRYMTPTLIFWCVLAILAAILAKRFIGLARLGLSAAAGMVLLGLSGVIVIDHALSLERPPAVRLPRDDAGLAMILGVYDREALLQIYPDPKVPWNARDALMESGRSMFSLESAHWVGRNVRDLFDLARNDRCLGGFDEASGSFPSNADAEYATGRVKGWAWDTKLRAVPDVIIVTDANGKIVGLGRSGYSRLDLVSMIPGGSVATGWQGYIKVRKDSMLTAYAVLGGNQMVCRIGVEKPAPRPLLEPEQVQSNAAIVPQETRIEGIWQIDGEDRIARRPRLDGTFFGSWAGSDGHVGRLILSGLSVPPGRRVAVPFVTGPDIGHQYIVLRNAAGSEVARFEPGVTREWAVAVLNLPEEAGSTFDLIAVDEGTAWGQWLAIGSPRAMPPE